MPLSPKCRVEWPGRSLIKTDGWVLLWTQVSHLTESIIRTDRFLVRHLFFGGVIASNTLPFPLLPHLLWALDWCPCGRSPCHAKPQVESIPYRKHLPQLLTSLTRHVTQSRPFSGLCGGKMILLMCVLTFWYGKGCGYTRVQKKQRLQKSYCPLCLVLLISLLTTFLLIHCLMIVRQGLSYRHH